MASEQLTLRGTLLGHADWVTAIATTNEDATMVVSSSRDKTILVWQVDGTQEEYGFARKSLRGHSHFVSSVVISSVRACVHVCVCACVCVRIWYPRLQPTTTDITSWL